MNIIYFELCNSKLLYKWNVLFLQLSFKGIIHWKMIRSSKSFRLAFPLLILVVFHVPVSSYSNSTINSREFTFTNNLLKLATKDEPKLRSEHPLANAWMINSAIGVIGTFFNSFELFVFYRERHQMINSVNVMIWSVNHFSEFLYFSISCLGWIHSIEWCIPFLFNGDVTTSVLTKIFLGKPFCKFKTF